MAELSAILFLPKKLRLQPRLLWGKNSLENATFTGSEGDTGWNWNVGYKKLGELYGITREKDMWSCCGKYAMLIWELFKISRNYILIYSWQYQWKKGNEVSKLKEDCVFRW